MPTLIQISDKYHISLKKLQVMDQDGLFRDIIAPTPLEEISLSLRKCNPLSARQIVLLLHNPDWLEKFDDSQLWSAKSQLKHIGNLSDALPADRLPHILLDNASGGIAKRITELAVWIASVIPPVGCGYHYIAARALLNVPEGFLDLSSKLCSKAIMKARKDPALAGMSETKNRQTRFFHPTLDL